LNLHEFVAGRSRAAVLTDPPFFQKGVGSMTKLGRKPQGAALVAALSGSEHTKRRLTLFLQTMSGQCSVGEACRELDIGESRFFAQRAEWLEESLALLEPGSPGRPAKPAPLPEPAEVKTLRERVRELEHRLRVAEARSDLACSLPRLAGESLTGKKK
jgi:transposase-like protein